MGARCGVVDARCAVEWYVLRCLIVGLLAIKNWYNVLFYFGMISSYE